MPRGRHKARMVALQCLYEAETAGHDPEAALSHQREALLKETADFALELVRGVVNHRQEIDALIQRHATLFPVGQLSAIDRNILRIAILEMFIDNKVSVKVAIDEAVELAKAFGSESSSRFINGVLGALSTKVAR